MSLGLRDLLVFLELPLGAVLILVKFFGFEQLFARRIRAQLLHQPAVLTGRISNHLLILRVLVFLA